MKFILIFIGSLFFYSCQTNDCALPNYELTREVNFKVNKEVEESLNVITSILRSGIYLKNNLPNEKTAARLENEIYFNLDKESNILHFKEIYYDQEIGLNKSLYINYDIPISEIDITDLDIIYSISGGVYDNSASLKINSKFRNPSSFKIKYIKVKNGEEKVTDCITDSAFFIILKSDNAEALKSALQKLVKYY